MKVCKKCKIEKSLEDFNKDSKNKDGLWTVCKECRLGHKPHKPILNGLKLCITCCEKKDTRNFSITKAKGKLYLQSSCKTCRNKKKSLSRKSEPIKEAYRKRKQKLKADYNISVEEYNKLLMSQNGGCKICNKNNNGKKHFAVDHCHLTGVIRGLLCTNCNITLGLMKDNSQLLQNAINYLKETSTDKS